MSDSARSHSAILELTDVVNSLDSQHLEAPISPWVWAVGGALIVVFGGAALPTAMVAALSAGLTSGVAAEKGLVAAVNAFRRHCISARTAEEATNLGMIEGYDGQ